MERQTLKQARMLRESEPGLGPPEARGLGAQASLEEAGSKWEGCLEEGNFGTILMKEQELSRQGGLRVGRDVLCTGNSLRCPEDILLNPQNNPRRQAF